MRGQSGLTLLELLLSTALVGLVMALTLPFAHVQKALWERQEDEREAWRTLCGALAWIARDLQQAGYHEEGPPLQRIEETAFACLLSRDEEEPAQFSAANRRLVTVSLDGDELKYRTQAPLPPPAAGWESGSTQVIASGISGMRCRALDAGGAETAAPGEAALVECTLRCASGAQATLAVGLRNAGRGALP